MRANQENYRRLESWLDSNDIEYHKLNDHQYRVLGDVAIVDVWPARMTVHVIATEGVDPNRYFRLDYDFNGEQLARVLAGKGWL